MRMCLCMSLLALLCMQTHSLQWVNMQQGRNVARDLARPGAVDEGTLLGAEPVGMYQRKTQAPLVWINLHKSKFPSNLASWHAMGYKERHKRPLYGSTCTNQNSLQIWPVGMRWATKKDTSAPCMDQPAQIKIPFKSGQLACDGLQRKTQAPLVWINLHKSKFPSNLASWHAMAYKEEARQELGMMQDLVGRA